MKFETFFSLTSEKRSTRMAMTMLSPRMVIMIAKDTSKSTRQPRTVNDGGILGTLKGISYIVGKVHESQKNIYTSLKHAYGMLFHMKPFYSHTI